MVASTPFEARTEQASTPITGDVGWVWSGSPTGSFNANSNFSYNSSHGTNHITNTGTGTYRVDFPGLGSVSGGDVQVTAYGGGSERCKVYSWGSSGSTLQVTVNCFTTAGLPVNTLFTANYVRRSDTPGAQPAYVWAFDPSSASYNAASSYSWNSTGGGIAITHAPESQFDVLFSTRSPNGSPSSSYLWADQPSTPSYQPNSAYALGLINIDVQSWPNIVSTAPTITRSTVGHYSVRFPLMANNVSYPSNLKVTGYGGGSDTCKVTGWSASGQDGVANVACFDASGYAIDAYYTITYSSFAYIVG